MALARARDFVKIPLQQVEARLDQVVASIDDETTRRWMAYFAAKSGHRLRPLLVLLSYSAFKPLNGRAPDKLVDLAAILELMHSASLIHDDVIDEEEDRRGQKALQHLTGNRAAVLLGNVFYLNAFEIAFTMPAPEYFLDMTRTATEMCFGEVLQSENRGAKLNEQDYLKIIRCKTAGLMDLSCRSAARLAGASEELRHAAGRLGLLMGYLYQLRDDVKDQDIALASDVDVCAIACRFHTEFCELLAGLAIDPAVRQILNDLELLISQDFLAGQ